MSGDPSLALMSRASMRERVRGWGRGVPGMSAVTQIQHECGDADSPPGGLCSLRARIRSNGGSHSKDEAICLLQQPSVIVRMPVCDTSSGPGGLEDKCLQ
ncbi:hypothetical protein NDU88_005881 [Pleurodeles waltl]|uniref:Uncharacterized protein n=1 Tax=Pleurodeles waltl TaxID=8319 RepID=A0AAV7VL75_PLEWA|nr:hypothetical protein NDU88_005881 [Pleurodeles waltl]